MKNNISLHTKMLEDSIGTTKEEIATLVKAKIQSESSFRKLGKQIGISPSQINRVTNEENYTIDTLLKVLHALGLQIQVGSKIDESKE